ncbi:MAG TPA: hypothetical protein VMU80_29070, partial [Bryobacteraceae bacterium]|nr:hypothetical protein [Bryobacteraceae bacterium]
MKPQPQHEDDHVAIDRIREELQQLEARVDALEHRTEPRAAPAPLLVSAPADAFGLPTAPNAFGAAG